MVTNAELIFWVVVGIISIVGILMLACKSDESLYVSQETIRRIENGGRHL